MSDKKSYMNNESILAEGFFSKLAKMLGLSSTDKKRLKKNKKVTNALKDYNKSWKNLEKKELEKSKNTSKLHTPTIPTVKNPRFKR